MIVLRPLLAPLALGIMMVAAAGPASAQSVRVLGEHSAWTAYATTESSGEICFVMSQPESTEPEPAGFTEGHFYITHRPGDGVESEINLVSGYQFAPESTATLSVGAESFELFTQEDAAWLSDRSATEDARAAIRGGATMVIEGTAAGGQTVRQTFSLSGATAATNEIDSAC